MSGRKRPVVALPETRQLDVLAEMLERRDVDVRRCPMIAIRDQPDRDAVLAWIERFNAGQMDLFVVYTGEGIQRLTGAAEDAGLKDPFVRALASTPLLTRGPKPARALRALGVRPEYPAVEPTTEGVIRTLGSIPLDGRRVGVQLYNEEPLPALMAFLADRGATVDSVAPYVYASEADDEAVRSLIAAIGAGEIDAVAFTSKAQVERLARVSKRSGGPALAALLEPVVVAAVGPVAAAELERSGARVDVVPESGFFMKPMVTALLNRLADAATGSGSKTRF